MVSVLKSNLPDSRNSVDLEVSLETRSFAIFLSDPCEMAHGHFG